MPALTGHLPNYNPDRRDAFSREEWQHVCRRAAGEFKQRQLTYTARCIALVGQKPSPRNSIQDDLDAFICLLAALDFFEGRDFRKAGDMPTGCMIFPRNGVLHSELARPCYLTGRNSLQWARVVKKP
jgi:predicted RNase H-like nuclease